MTLEEAVYARHAVRAYTDAPIGEEEGSALRQEIDACNAEGNLAIRLVQNEPKAFQSFLAKYGKFSGAANYLAIAGAPAEDLNERAGYYGERVGLKAQTRGMNTCWAALSLEKGKAKRAADLQRGEKLICVIAIGHGQTQGVPHKGKTFADVAAANDPPDWFLRGVEFALLAPTAVNQQKFRFALFGQNEVLAERTGGFYGDIDLGIVKYHFELGAGKENFCWKE